ncbi:hypothetical protein QOT17_005225 [Balamuthia mandrillaris]
MTSFLVKHPRLGPSQCEPDVWFRAYPADASCFACGNAISDWPQEQKPEGEASFPPEHYQKTFHPSEGLTVLAWMPYRRELGQSFAPQALVPIPRRHDVNPTFEFVLDDPSKGGEQDESVLKTMRVRCVPSHWVVYVRNERETAVTVSMAVREGMVWPFALGGRPAQFQVPAGETEEVLLKLPASRDQPVRHILFQRHDLTVRNGDTIVFSAPKEEEKEEEEEAEEFHIEPFRCPIPSFSYPVRVRANRPLTINTDAHRDCIREIDYGRLYTMWHETEPENIHFQYGAYGDFALPYIRDTEILIADRSNANLHRVHGTTHIVRVGEEVSRECRLAAKTFLLCAARARKECLGGNAEEGPSTAAPTAAPAAAKRDESTVALAQVPQELLEEIITLLILNEEEDQVPAEHS